MLCRLSALPQCCASFDKNGLSGFAIREFAHQIVAWLYQFFPVVRKELKSLVTWFRSNRQQTALLRHVVDRVRNSLESKVVLQTAVDEVADLLKVDRCVFFWYFHDTHRIQVICESYSQPAQLVWDQADGAHDPCSSRLGYYPVESFGTLAPAIARGELVVHHGTATQLGIKRWLGSWYARLLPQRPQAEPGILGSIAAMLVPLKSQDGSVGFIACLAKHPRRWSVTEIELLQAIAQQIEIALGQAQLYEKTQKQAQRERLVNQIITQTRQSFELETILRGAIAQLLDALQVDRCLVHLVEDPNQGNASATLDWASDMFNARQSASREKHLYEVCRPPFQPSIDAFDTSGPITRWVVDYRRRVVISDVSNDERIGSNNAEYQQAEIKSSLVVPVQTKENLYAILYLNQCSHVRDWSKDDQKLAQAVADQLAITIQQAHLYAQTQQQAAESAAQAQHLAATLQELQLTQAQLIQSEKMSSLGRIVAGIAHEINNPINFIFGNLPYVELYIQNLLSLLKVYQTHYPVVDSPDLQVLANDIELDFLMADLPRILSSMKAGADRIREIVLSLRNFARLDESQCKVVDIHEGIDSTLLVLRSNIPEDVRIIRSYGELPLIECYPRQLNQVIMNILMNALDALNSWDRADKAIAICTDLITDADIQEPMIRIVITDNGPGVPHEIQSKIFDPFFTTKEVGQGIGLGLTVSYQIIVNQHRGQLKFYSEPGLGAEFMIEIPIRQFSATAPSPAESELAEQPTCVLNGVNPN
ncbi:histidine kinase with GAF domain [Leptolyngbyaceae cyanobacterium JSC-12]|nr:histidine kinase with GAF domain [Leptolyngbyaceae cyanobacterium JSC-12]